MAADAMRFAKPQEIIGDWKMVPITNADKIDKVHPYPLPYQWFKFYKDGRVMWLMKTADARYSAKDLEGLLELAQGPLPKYSWRDGFMIISNEGREEAWGVNIFLEDYVFPGVKALKGDIMMTLAGGADGHIVYHRLLRRLPK